MISGAWLTVPGVVVKLSFLSSNFLVCQLQAQCISMPITSALSVFLCLLTSSLLSSTCLSKEVVHTEASQTQPRSSYKYQSPSHFRLNLVSSCYIHNTHNIYVCVWVCLKIVYPKIWLLFGDTPTHPYLGLLLYFSASPRFCFCASASLCLCFCFHSAAFLLLCFRLCILLLPRIASQVSLGHVFTLCPLLILIRDGYDVFRHAKGTSRDMGLSKTRGSPKMAIFMEKKRKHDGQHWYTMRFWLGFHWFSGTKPICAMIKDGVYIYKHI